MRMIKEIIMAPFRFLFLLMMMIGYAIIMFLMWLSRDDGK